MHVYTQVQNSNNKPKQQTTFDNKASEIQDRHDLQSLNTVLAAHLRLHTIPLQSNDICNPKAGEANQRAHAETQTFNWINFVYSTNFCIAN